MSVTDRILGEAMTPWQKRIHKDPRKAVDWSLKNYRRFPEAEPYIAKDPRWAYEYARDVIGDRWPEAERESLVNEPRWAVYYAEYIIKDRWPEAEPTIAKDPGWACWYATNIINKKVWGRDDDENSNAQRWPEAEPTIAKSLAAYDYAMDVIKGQWPEAEEAIAKSEYKDHYLKEWPEAKDDWILKGWLDWMDT